MQTLFNTQGQRPPPPYEDYHIMPRSHFEHGLRADYEYLRADYEDLRADYEDLRADYEDLRYTFHNPGLISSVWQIPPAPKNGHPTPKPLPLLERIVLTTSSEGDLVLDPMMGRGTTGHAAVKHGRRFVGIELDESHYTYAKERIERARDTQLELF